MIEWAKILKRKKVIGIIIGLLAFQVFLFLYFAQTETDDIYEEESVVIVNGEEVTVYEEEDTEQSFRESIEAIINQADAMSSVSIFAQPGSFSYKNIQKTKEDYETLLDVEPVEFDDGFLTKFFDDFLLNGLVVICGIIIAFNLVDENKAGLKCMIFSARDGRGRLTLKKIAALLMWDAVICVLFYGVSLVASCLRYGGSLVSCLGYPVQSVEMFAKLPLVVTIGEFLGIYLIYRIFILFVITLIVWFILYCVEHLLLSVGMIGVIGIISYLTGTVIKSDSPLAFFKYCSLWYLMYDSSFFSEYRNINIFNSAVNKNTAALTADIVVIIFLCAISFAVGTKRYPCPSRMGKVRSFFMKAGKRMQRIYGAALERLSVTGAEWFKALFTQKGILVIAAFVIVIVYQADFGEVLRSGEVDLYYDFMSEYSGLPSEASSEYISDFEAMLAEVDLKYADAEEKYNAGEISFDEYFNYSVLYDTFQSERLFLERIQNQTAYLEDLKEYYGIDGWYVNTFTYSNILAADNSLTDVLLILCVILLCSGIFAGEENCGIVQVMRTARKGRGYVFRRKMGMAVAITLLLYLFSTAMTLAQIVHTYGLETLGAPVQSIEPLVFVPFSCSIGVFIVLLYILRAAVLLVVAAFTCMLSANTSQKFAVAVSFVLCVPAVFSLVGFDFMQYVSIIRILSIVPFLLQVQSIGAALAVCAVFLAIGAASVINGYRKWCVT